MRAWVLRDRRGPEGLVLEEVPEPEPGAGEVLVEVVATALNRADLLQCRGLYPAPAARLEIPGLELSGRVLRTGPRCRRFRPGDRVTGLVSQGAWAERAAVPETSLMPLPRGADPIRAGGFAECALTVFDALRLHGRLEAGRRVLIHAASSGIGTAALRLARRYGARTIASTSRDKIERVAALGPEVVVDRETEDLVERVTAWSGGAGVDLVLDTLGAGAAETNLRALRHGGTVVTIGLLAGARAEIDLGLLLGRRATLRGSVLRSRSTEQKAALVEAFLRECGEAWARGDLDPVVEKVISYETLPDGLRSMKGGRHVGKIVVRIDQERET